MSIDVGQNCNAAAAAFRRCGEGAIKLRDASEAAHNKGSRTFREAKRKAAEKANRKDEEERKKMKCDEDDDVCWIVKSGVL